MSLSDAVSTLESLQERFTKLMSDDDTKERFVEAHADKFADGAAKSAAGAAGEGDPLAWHSCFQMFVKQFDEVLEDLSASSKMSLSEIGDAARMVLEADTPRSREMDFFVGQLALISSYGYWKTWMIAESTEFLARSSAKK